MEIKSELDNLQIYFNKMKSVNDENIQLVGLEKLKQKVI